MVSRGSGLFLGTIGGRGLLLTAAHVLWAPTQVGAPSSPHSIVLELPGATIEARFAEIEFYGSDSDIEELNLQLSDIQRQVIARLLGV